jgi:hypothetical protein
MEKCLYWLVRWPWIAGLAASVGLAQVHVGTWYVTAWLVVGAAVVIWSLARASKIWLTEDLGLDRFDRS